MKDGHPSREHAKGMKRRDHMEGAGEHMARGVKHLAEHHAEEKREIDHGKNRERGMSGKDS